MDKIIITIGGFLAIVFTAWFFFGKKDKEVEAKDRIEIKVSGGYNPSSIILQKGKKTTLSFLRTDPSECLEEVVLSDFKIRRHLPLNQKVDIKIEPKESGEFDMSCAMNMFHGKITVR